MKKLFWSVSVLLSMAFLAQPSMALSWGDFNVALAHVDGGGTPDPMIVGQLQEIVNTFDYYTNTLKQQHPNSLLFCAPDLSNVTLEEIANGIRAQAVEQQAADNVSVQELMMNALAKAYPC